jgi:hypothetical protein
MKTSQWPSLALAALLAAWSGSLARAGLFSDNFQVIVVAERATDAPPVLENATSYVAFDGGYVEAGDPVAGDNPPSADQVRQDLAAALASQGFQASGSSPSLMLIYHWGVIRADHRAIKVPYEIRKNEMARIALVSTEHTGTEVENSILNGEKGGGQNLNASSPLFLTAPLDAVYQHARVPRIFVVVSAYDFQAFAQHRQARLVWRTKLSAQDNSGDMAEVIPPLIAKGASFLGKGLPDVTYAETTLQGRPSASAGASASSQPSPAAYGLDKDALDGLIRQERIRFSGTDSRPE